MSDPYHDTQLIFQGKLRAYRIPVRWGLLFGDGPTPRGSWIASITFETFPVPDNINALVFAALSNPTVQVKFQNEAGELVDCNISDILDLTDCGSIQISSVDLPHAKMIPGNGPTFDIEI